MTLGGLTFIKISKSYKRILMTFSGNADCGPRKSSLNFSDVQDSGGSLTFEAKGLVYLLVSLYSFIFKFNSLH